MSKNTVTMRDTIYMVVFMHLVALAYLIIIQYNVVDKGHLDWDTNLGELMLTPAVICVVYAWIVLFFKWIGWTDYTEHEDSPKVLANKGQWKAKAVHWLSKFPH